MSERVQRVRDDGMIGAVRGLADRERLAEHCDRVVGVAARAEDLAERRERGRDLGVAVAEHGALRREREIELAARCDAVAETVVHDADVVVDLCGERVLVTERALEHCERLLELGERVVPLTTLLDHERAALQHEGAARIVGGCGRAIEPHDGLSRPHEAVVGLALDHADEMDEALRSLGGDLVGSDGARALDRGHQAIVRRIELAELEQRCAALQLGACDERHEAERLGFVAHLRRGIARSGEVSEAMACLRRDERDAELLLRRLCIGGVRSSTQALDVGARRDTGQRRHGTDRGVDLIGCRAPEQSCELADLRGDAVETHASARVVLVVERARDVVGAAGRRCGVLPLLRERVERGDRSRRARVGVTDSRREHRRADAVGGGRAPAIVERCGGRVATGLATLCSPLIDAEERAGDGERARTDGDRDASRPRIGTQRDEQRVHRRPAITR